VHISCRNRHCPKCQALARALWLEARKADLLPVPYFHVVFTIPEPIAAIALQNKRVVYDNLTTPRCHLGCPAAISGVDQHQQLAAARHQGADGHLNCERAGALWRNGDVRSLAVHQGHEPAADPLAHCDEIRIARSPVAAQRRPGRVGGRQRSGCQQQRANGVRLPIPANPGGLRRAECGGTRGTPRPRHPERKQGRDGSSRQQRRLGTRAPREDRDGERCAVRVVVCAAERVGLADGCMQPSEVEALGVIRAAVAPQSTVVPTQRVDHELHAGDGETALAFYSGLFGWTKTQAIDMGAMSTYQTFMMAAATEGAMGGPESVRP